MNLALKGEEYFNAVEGMGTMLKRAVLVGNLTDVADAGADTTVPGGRKRANTTSRWEGGGGAPKTAPGEARQDGKRARHDGDGE